MAMYPALKEEGINLKLCNKLHISGQLGSMNLMTEWTDNEKIKATINFDVDKGMFYVQNFYPSGLIYGHIINRRKINIIRNSFSSLKY
ncbi:hypothetical protein [Piscirickettsia salmonis]|uniref:hypothetical protein n=1 Tax=Piscirickettsia salmonis TaxID=1238 RepID=UPI0016626865|nr:hypothetical protein [Piscirickettsia salmonis]QNR82492.1 hypothetical protein ICC15_18645 [Piscirickettsia salmonis]